MVIDPRSTGPYDGLSSYVALAQPMTDFCTVSKGCSVFCSFAVVRNSRNSIPERLLKIHGRWKSDSAKDMYIEQSLENRLRVTKYLGL